MRDWAGMAVVKFVVLRRGAPWLPAGGLVRHAPDWGAIRGGRQLVHGAVPVARDGIVQNPPVWACALCSRCSGPSEDGTRRRGTAGSVGMHRGAGAARFQCCCPGRSTRHGWCPLAVGVHRFGRGARKSAFQQRARGQTGAGSPPGAAARVRAGPSSQVRSCMGHPRTQQPRNPPGPAVPAGTRLLAAPPSGPAIL